MTDESSRAGAVPGHDRSRSVGSGNVFEAEDPPERPLLATQAHRHQGDSMSRTSFPQTTPSQRRLLFETWEASGDTGTACRTAHVGERTFS